MNKKNSLFAFVMITSLGSHGFGGGPDDSKHPEEAGPAHTARANDKGFTDFDKDSIREISQLSEYRLKLFLNQLVDAAYKHQPDKTYFTAVRDLKSDIETNENQINSVENNKQEWVQKLHSLEALKENGEDFIYEFSENTLDQDIAKLDRRIQRSRNAIKILEEKRKELFNQIAAEIMRGRRLAEDTDSPTFYNNRSTAKEANRIFKIAYHDARRHIERGL